MEIEKPFMFLCKLAWEARYRIPIIISVVFVVFDVRMQVEINVQMRTVRRRARGGQVDEGVQQNDEEEGSESDGKIGDCQTNASVYNRFFKIPG